MVNLYADLVEFGVRVLEPEEGKIAVPAFLREGVRLELERRAALQSQAV